MTILFWTSLAIITYTYAGYPIAIALLARIRPRSWRKSAWPDGPPPVTIIMAVHNGERMLAAQLHHLLTLEPALVARVIVVSDGSTDQTNFILKSQKNTRLETVILPAHSGKSVALNAAIPLAETEILLFVDIRPQVQPGALAALLSNFADPNVGCVAGELLLNSEGHSATTGAVSGLYWRYEQYIRNCEAAVDSPTGVYGGFYAIRRSAATLYPPGLILDDMFQPLSLIRKGYRSVLDREAYVVDTWPATSAGEFSRKVRTLAGNFQLLAEAPWLLTPANRVLFQLLSHKLLRLVVPYFFILLLLATGWLALDSAAFALFGLLQTIFWFFAVVALRFRIPIKVVNKIAAPASALLVLNAAAIAGLYKFLFTRGPLWKIWSPTPVVLDSDAIPPQSF
jgi:cellulose synthase/poly-beta-1,6-N-acetylglucosamine synthase-like glycosyltransferase